MVVQCPCSWTRGSHPSWAPLTSPHNARQALYRRGQAHQALGAPAAALPDLAAALAASPALEKPIIAEKLAAARKAAGLADAADADDVEQIEQVILAERLSVSADGKPCCNHSPYAHAVTCDCQGIAAIQTLCKCGQPNTRLHLPVTALPADRMQVTGSTASSRPIITEVTDDTSTTQRAGATPAMVRLAPCRRRRRSSVSFAR